MNAAAESDLALLSTQTIAVYERNAARFDAERPKRLHERPWLDRFLALLPAGGTILDAGCGAGDPIAAYFMRQGFTVTGVDAAVPMLDIARDRYPQGDWRQADLRILDLPSGFDGVISWNSFFHLTRDEQRLSLPRLCAHLNPGGALLLTVGPEAGEVIGQVGDDAVYHASLAPAEYESILGAHGIQIVQFVAEDPACDEQTVLLARLRSD